ncbi:MAG: hypothetical protein ACOZBL_00960 [Patescibacteria group bacterium]
MLSIFLSFDVESVLINFEIKNPPVFWICGQNLAILVESWFDRNSWSQNFSNQYDFQITSTLANDTLHQKNSRIFFTFCSFSVGFIVHVEKIILHQGFVALIAETIS